MRWTGWTMPRREGGREVQTKLREFVAEKPTDGPPFSNANLAPFCLGREKGVHEEYQLGSCSFKYCRLCSSRHRIGRTGVTPQWIAAFISIKLRNNRSVCVAGRQVSKTCVSSGEGMVYLALTLLLCTTARHVSHARHHKPNVNFFVLKKFETCKTHGVTENRQTSRDGLRWAREESKRTTT